MQFSCLIFNLRISREIDSMMSVFMRIIPEFFVIFSILTFSFITAPALTAKILKPLEETTENIQGIMRVKNCEIDTYDEPFLSYKLYLNRIRE